MLRDALPGRRCVALWKGSSGRHPRDSLDAGWRRCALRHRGLRAYRLRPENLCSSGARSAGGSFYVCSAARGCRPPGHLGTGPAARDVRCITLWPALARRPPRLPCEVPRV